MKFEEGDFKALLRNEPRWVSFVGTKALFVRFNAALVRGAGLAGFKTVSFHVDKKEKALGFVFHKNLKKSKKQYWSARTLVASAGGLRTTVPYIEGVPRLRGRYDINEQYDKKKGLTYYYIQWGKPRGTVARQKPNTSRLKRKKRAKV